MKKVILPVLFLLLAWSGSLFAQESMIESFDNISADTNFVWTGNTEGAPSYLNVKEDSTDKVEGAASLDVKTAIGAFHGWGSYSQIQYRLPDGQTMDWSSSDTLKLWIKVVKPPTIPANMLFRVTIYDQDAPGDPLEAYVMDNTTAIDSQTDWYLLSIPFKEINSQDGTVIPGDSGFVMAPYTWGGFTYNDKKLNTDKIVGWNIGFITSGWDANANLPADSLELKLDGFERSGNKAIPFVIFNGITTPTDQTTFSTFTWGDASMQIENNAGPVPNSNAIHWVMGDQWGSGWNGVGYNIDPAFNLSGGWPVDSLHFTMKVDVGVDSMRVQFEDGTAQIAKVFTVIQDTLWHNYTIALRDINARQDTNLSTAFNPANIKVWQIMSQADGKAGKNVYLTNVWTGNPQIDVVPPVAPTGISVSSNNDNSNTIVWTDVPGLTGETYNVYYSLNPITDVTAGGVEVLTTGVVHGVDMAIHKLLAPGSDQSVSYYYAVVCRSAAGILGNPGVIGSAISNTAHGVSVISPTAPANFQADGDLSEWTNAGIKPFRLYPSDNSGTIVPGSKISSDTVSSGDVYVAVDQNYLYVAGHINTNNIVFDASQSSWFNTATDLYLGLYNWHGASHTSLEKGAEPDYHFRFAQDRVIIDNDGVDSLTVPGTDYYWAQRFPDPLAGYNFEVKIPWTDIAHKANGGSTRTDNVFVPAEGMRIPFDIELGTCSTGATQRDGQLDYSSIANGNSYQNVAVWSYTWIGDKWNVTGVNNTKQNVYTYQLNQNYPNPFNPTTVIQYSLMNAGKVTLKVYDILGREVKTLVNQYQSAGSYKVSFDASRLASGVYFYQIEAGSFRTVKKMMLLK